MPAYNILDDPAPQVVRAAIASGTTLANSALPRNTSTPTPIPTPHVGKLPLVHFINIIIGALVFLLCITPTVVFLRRADLTSLRDWKPKDSKPLFAARPTPSKRIRTSTQTEVGKQRSNYKLTSTSPEESSPLLRPNIPLPINIKDQDPSKPLTTQQQDFAIVDITECKNLTKEKLRTDAIIKNLQRLKGGGGTRLQEALSRRVHLEARIDEIFTRFRERREAWDQEEWELLERVIESWRQMGEGRP